MQKQEVSYVIGREPDPGRPRIVLEDKSISRNHGLISGVGDGRYVLEDMNSANGTYIRERGGWRRVERVTVGINDEVRLGMYVTSVSALLQRAVHTPGRTRLERNPETGEIVRKPQ
jgi:pSer/pThr/pTyr-binding forkhead associated (FHA) protein